MSRVRNAHRDAMIVGLAREGVRPKRIALALGVSASVVHCVLKAARDHDPKVPRFHAPRGGMRRGRRQMILVDAALMQQLEGPALSRATSAAGLARKILGVVVEAGLIDAVLDDGVGATPPLAPPRKGEGNGRLANGAHRAERAPA